MAAREPPERRAAERPRLAATALEQFASLRFDRAEANVRKATERIHAQRVIFGSRLLMGAISGGERNGERPWLISRRFRFES